MTFTPLDDDTRTLVEITEEGWRENEGALRGELRQLPGLVADARRAEGLGRARHQPARGHVRLTNARCWPRGAMYLSQNAKSEQPASARAQVRDAPPNALRD